MPGEPNLFAHATSELSQDAALCWLLEWADPSCATIDREMHAAGRAFLESLYRLHGRDCPAGHVRVYDQVVVDSGRADIVATVGDHDLLVVEDKVDATQRPGQLRDYRDALTRHYRIDVERFLGVYLKTGDEASYGHVTDVNGWRVCSRRDLLGVLAASKSTNVVLRDFRAHLEAIQQDVDSFRMRPRSEWPRWDDDKVDRLKRQRPWAGVFIALTDRLPSGWWKYVANQQGGFMCFWLPKRDVGGRDLKVQLENERLVIKLIGKPATERRRWSRHVIAQLKEFDLRPPERLGAGNYVTIARREQWCGPDDARIDIEASAALVRSIDEALSRMSPPSG